MAAFQRHGACFDILKMSLNLSNVVKGVCNKVSVLGNKLIFNCSWTSSQSTLLQELADLSVASAVAAGLNSCVIIALLIKLMSKSSAARVVTSSGSVEMIAIP